MSEGEVAALIIGCVALWVVFKSPILRWIVGFIVLVFVGFGIALAALFVALVIDIPAGHYGAATGAIILGLFFSVLTSSAAYGPLIDHCRSLPQSMELWDKS